MLTKRSILGTGALALALTLVVAGCSEDRANGPVASPGAITGPDPALSPSAGAGAGSNAGPERLARRVARALRNPAFRAYVKAQLDHSTFREHKLQFQSFLRANGRRGLTALATENAESEAGVAGEADSARALEFYFPVQSHRAAWTGDENILVATAEADGDIPVAFDTRGRRTLLDPRTPPTTPVLAIVPVETDFSEAPNRLTACLDPNECGGSGGGTGGIAGGGSGGASTVGLFMTAAHIPDDYESWLKGDPEFEVHILGQAGQSDSLTSYQCAGEHAGGPYYYDQDHPDWAGSVLLFSQAQFDAYRAAHPGKSVRVFFLEDDDGPCQIKADGNRFVRLLEAVDAAYKALTGGRDSTTLGTAVKTYHRAATMFQVLTAAWSFLVTQDDLVGTAVEDAVVGTLYPGFNWIIKGENNITKGWVNLEMR